MICQGCPGPISDESHPTAPLHSPCWQKPRRCSGRRWAPTLCPLHRHLPPSAPLLPMTGPATVWGTSSMLLGGASHHLLLTRGQVSHYFQQKQADMVSSSCRRKEEDARTGPEWVRGFTSPSSISAPPLLFCWPQMVRQTCLRGVQASWRQLIKKKLTTGGASIHEVGEGKQRFYRNPRQRPTIWGKQENLTEEEQLS